MLITLPPPGRSLAFSSGDVLTTGYTSNGMTADNGSLAFNTGSILTEGVFSYGMVARYGSAAVNTGSIETTNYRALGMYAWDGSLLVNTGEITTGGDDSEGMKAENLVVKSTYADEGPTLKRFRPRAKGSASPIRKRSCHITIIVAPREEA